MEPGTHAQAVHKPVGDVHRATVLNYESIVADGEADDLLRSGDRGPDHVLVDRERRAYLSDAVLALPERLRAVVIGYFYQERPMLEIAACSDFRARLDAAPRSLLERAAEAGSPAPASA